MPIDYIFDNPLARILAEQKAARAFQPPPEEEEVAAPISPSPASALQDAILAREREESNYEKIIREKLLKGPRERAEELTAKAWKDRYGVTESSGKFRRIMAGLSEVGRAIGSGKNYESIPDRARHAAEKEYTAEVGPLQRELGVLSQARTAGNQLQQRMMEAANKQTLAQAGIMLKNRVADATIQKTLGLTDQEYAKTLKTLAETGNIDAKTALTELQTKQLESTRGFKGGAANAWLQTQLPKEEQNTFLGALAQQVAATKGTEALFKGGGAGAGGGRTSTRTGGSWKEVGTVDGRKEFQWFPNTSTMVSGGGGNAANSLAQTYDNWKRLMGGASNVMGDPAPPPAQPAAGPVPLAQALKPQPATPKVAAAAAAKSDVPVALQTNITAPGKSDFINNNLGVYKGLRSVWHGAEFDNEADLPERARSVWIGSERNLTEQDKARDASFVLVNRAANTAIDATLKDALSWNVGPLGSAVGTFNRMRGKSQPEATKLVQEVEDGLAQFVKMISGTQVSDAEARRLKEVLANRGDNENTFLQKVISTSLRTAETTWADRARLSRAERQAMFSNSAVLKQSLEIEKTALAHLQAAKAAQRNRQETYRIPGRDIDYPTSAAKDFVSDMVTNVSKQMTNQARKILAGNPNVPPETSFRKGK